MNRCCSAAQSNTLGVEYQYVTTTFVDRFQRIVALRGAGVGGIFVSDRRGGSARWARSAIRTAFPRVFSSTTADESRDDRTRTGLRQGARRARVHLRRFAGNLRPCWTDAERAACTTPQRSQRFRAPRTGLGFDTQCGGEGGIRTRDTLASMPHFECGAFNHSATSPTCLTEQLQQLKGRVKLQQANRRRIE